MTPPVALAVYAAGLAVVFGAASALGSAIGPVGMPRPAGHPAATAPQDGGATDGHGTAHTP